MAKILLADDDEMLALVLSEELKLQGYMIDTAHSAADTREFLNAFSYDLIILDWEFPDGDGVSIIENLRNSGNLAPLLMLTGKTATEEKARGLEAGADDYLCKPFHEKELFSRIRALLRRPEASSSRVLKVADLSLNLSTRQVQRGDRLVKLQPIEFDVLEFFMKNPGTIFSVTQILQSVWKDSENVSEEAIYTCINRLRKKLDEQGKPSIFSTVQGKGYELAVS